MHVIHDQRQSRTRSRGKRLAPRRARGRDDQRSSRSSSSSLELVQVVVVVEIVFFIIIDVDVVDFVVEFFVDVFVILIVELLVVELLVLVVVEVIADEAVLVVELFSFRFSSSSPGCRPNNGGRESGQPSHIASAALGSASVASDSRQSNISSVLRPREFIGEFPLTNALRMADSLLG